jgi:tRNA A58 N-methylase Trm61
LRVDERIGYKKQLVDATDSTDSESCRVDLITVDIQWEVQLLRRAERVLVPGLRELGKRDSFCCQWQRNIRVP